MSITDQIANSNPLAPAQAYNKHVSSNPYVEAGVLGTGGALAGYLGTDLLISRLAPSATPEKRRMLRNIIGALGGAAGATYALQKHVDPANPWESLADKDYWSKGNNRENLLARHQANIDSSEFDLEKVPKFDWGRGGRKIDAGTNIIPYEARRLLPQEVQQRGELNLAKEGSFLSAFDGRTVPVRTTIDLINQDPFLDLEDKKIVNGLIVDSNNGFSAGKTSGQSLMNTAVKAGIGYGASYLFGKGIGSLLSLPPEQTKTLSQVGGLAGAIYNSGILRQGTGI